MVGTLASLAVSAFAAAKQSQEMKKQQQYLNAQKRFNDLWYSGERDRDYLGTDEARSALKLAQDSIKKNISRINSAGAVTGMSDEAKVAANAAGMDSLNNVVNNIAGRADQRKDRAQAIYLDRKNQLEGKQDVIDQTNVNKWGNLGSNAGLISEAANINEMIPSVSDNQVAGMKEQDKVTNEMFPAIKPLTGVIKK